ncbi:type III secretion system chaperone [Pseudomonas sp. MAFF 311095]|uniref:Type III secretion system chaperone n=1 Tax=Pseudomonas petroselini TaxID=2899822 RepID=A0ABS8QVE8_9PSED|nr:CesT family type III secretion system chaperone [Pseudomonas petroselini]MCD7039139.1 type III secretion system chaperone [Pseudomonas petroselini]MCD7043533.1 type III secretion system chaperone [Pseudomonas petroselini]MCD7069277.1 type III secretion system chaperone [Pseudomonas petroselini]MCD7082439.1 type III secretion system chaperone [Pseudomonas petroselini]
MSKEDAILHSFGLKLGLPGLKFDASRACQLRVEGLKLAIYDNRVRKSMTILCELSDQSMSDTEVLDWHKFLFESQFEYLNKDTAVVGLNYRSGAMVAMSHIADHDLSLSQLIAKLNELIEWVLECSHRFATRSRQVLIGLSPPTYQCAKSLSRGHYA